MENQDPQNLAQHHHHHQGPGHRLLKEDPKARRVKVVVVAEAANQNLQVHLEADLKRQDFVPIFVEIVSVSNLKPKNLERR